MFVVFDDEFDCVDVVRRAPDRISTLSRAIYAMRKSAATVGCTIQGGTKVKVGETEYISKGILVRCPAALASWASKFNDLSDGWDFFLSEYTEEDNGKFQFREVKACIHSAEFMKALLGYEAEYSSLKAEFEKAVPNAKPLSIAPPPTPSKGLLDSLKDVVGDVGTYIVVGSVIYVLGPPLLKLVGGWLSSKAENYPKKKLPHYAR